MPKKQLAEIAIPRENALPRWESLMSKVLFNLLNVSFPGRTTSVSRLRRAFTGRSAYHHKNHDNNGGNANILACATCRFQNSRSGRSILSSLTGRAWGRCSELCSATARAGPLPNASRKPMRASEHGCVRRRLALSLQASATVAIIVDGRL